MKLTELYPYWSDVHQDIIETLRYLDASLWDAKPGHIDARSIRQIAVHLIDRERYFIGFIAQGLSIERPTASEFATTDSLVDALESTRAGTIRYIEKLEPAMLRTVRAVPEDTDGNIPAANMPLSWVIWQVIEHEIYHYGQIVMRIQS